MPDDESKPTTLPAPSSVDGNGNGHGDSTNAALTTPPPGYTKMWGGITGKGWKPGDRPNPTGMAGRRRPFTSALEVELERKIPDNHPILRSAPHLKGLTWANAVAVGQILSAVKGKADSANLIADRLEGKMTTPLAGYDGGPLIPSADKLPERIVEMLEESGVLAPVYEIGDGLKKKTAG